MIERKRVKQKYQHTKTIRFVFFFRDIFEKQHEQKICKLVWLHHTPFYWSTSLHRIQKINGSQNSVCCQCAQEWPGSKYLLLLVSVLDFGKQCFLLVRRSHEVLFMPELCLRVHQIAVDEHIKIACRRGLLYLLDLHIRERLCYQPACGAEMLPVPSSTTINDLDLHFFSHIDTKSFETLQVGDVEIYFGLRAW